jgi:hypothetical protein
MENETDLTKVGSMAAIAMIGYWRHLLGGGIHRVLLLGDRLYTGIYSRIIGKFKRRICATLVKSGGDGGGVAGNSESGSRSWLDTGSDVSRMWLRRGALLIAARRGIREARCAFLR